MYETLYHHQQHLFLFEKQNVEWSVLIEFFWVQVSINLHWSKLKKELAWHINIIIMQPQKWIEAFFLCIYIC